MSASRGEKVWKLYLLSRGSSRPKCAKKSFIIMNLRNVFIAARVTLHRKPVSLKCGISMSETAAQWSYIEHIIIIATVLPHVSFYESKGLCHFSWCFAFLFPLYIQSSADRSLSFQGPLVARNTCLQSLITAPGSLTEGHVLMGRSASQDYALIHSSPQILPSLLAEKEIPLTNQPTTGNL